MHDDSNIRTLRNGEGLHLVKSSDEAKGDIERRVAARRDGDPVLELVSDEAQPDDLEPRVRELPLDGAVFALRGEVALLRQEHKDLDESISALEAMPLRDQILIARLKRKKLALRDRIATIEDRINPDIIA
ncbi:MAG: YdcH family protein [Asticcacaulis sp.]